MSRIPRIRVIPSLLLSGDGLVKTTGFKKPVYVGDPINTVKIFNEKEVDEVVVLDISASRENKEPQFDKIAEIASEAFMPMGYGGGITNLDQVKKLFQSGVEKVILNTSVVACPKLMTQAADHFGVQSIVASIDGKKSLLGGYHCVTQGGRRKHRIQPAELARQSVESGAGEILINSVDQDGTMKGYDVSLIESVSSAVDVPVIACGGASKVSDFVEAVRQGGATAVSAGSMFVFHGVHRAVLINFPDEQVLTTQFFELCR